MSLSHQEIATELDLFHFEEHSPGMIFWHPPGYKLFRTIEEFMRKQHVKYGYKEIRTPMMLNKTLWEKTGHWDKFGDSIFIIPTESEDKQTYALKPMSCPGAIQVYQKGVKSHKMLPDRYLEFGVVHRNEPSGSLLGAMRLRQFTQDDAHLFCTEDQILDETENYIKMLQETYAAFGFHDGVVKLATRPEKRIGDDSSWDKAEKALEDACVQLGMEYVVNPGEGAFYGPKLEFTLTDNLDREWQCGTIQIDFNMAKRLGAVYIDENGDRQNPVLIHHAVLGSLERWVGILLENHNGELPLWLAPVQIVVASIVSDVDDYATKIHRRLLEEGYDAELDIRNEKLGKKIKDAQKRKIPYMSIVGKKEEANDEVNVRLLDGTQSNSSIDVLIHDMRSRIIEKS
jgi:threonyl-tRNA synthetase